jgi:hypothetical protein
MPLRIDSDKLEQLAAQIDAVAEQVGDSLRSVSGLVEGIGPGDWHDEVGRPAVDGHVQAAQSAYQGVLEALHQASTMARQRAAFGRDNGGG